MSRKDPNEAVLAPPGRTPLGPMGDALTSKLEASDVAQLQDALAIGDGDFRVTMATETLIGLLKPFNNRARAVLVALLRGYSKGMAATHAGIAEATLANWERAQPAFREATVSAYQAGFRRVFEPELYRRAMAGTEDRGSMRALELVTKARDSAYRDKAQMQLEVVHRAAESMGKLVAGWSEPAPETPSVP